MTSSRASGTSETLGSVRRFAAACILCTMIVACSRTEPTPPISDNSASRLLVVEHADTDTAVANARAVLAEFEKREVDYAKLGADLIEGIDNEDPRMIGAAVNGLARQLPRAFDRR